MAIKPTKDVAISTILVVIWLKHMSAESDIQPSAATIYLLSEIVAFFSFSICCFIILTYQLRKLFNCYGMKHIIHSTERRSYRTVVTNITYVKFDFICTVRICQLISMPHIILLFFIAGKYSYFLYVGFQKTVKYSMSKAAGSAGD